MGTERTSDRGRGWVVLLLAVLGLALAREAAFRRNRVRFGPPEDRRAGPDPT